MANFNKAFNFRGGFQVDTDVLIVRGQNVGIGSTIPDERLVVNGTIQANGLKVLSTEEVELEQARAGILSVTDYLNVGVDTVNPSAFVYPFGRPRVLIETGIVTSANPALGVVTYYGDGAQLLNLPTSQWLDVDVGLGFTSIYAQGYVGVATDDPRYEFQVGGVPFATRTGPFIAAQTGVGIERGNVHASGIVSALGEFIGVGSNITVLNADNIAIGSIGSMRYGSVINTEEVYADRFIGIADTAASVTFDAELVFTSGIATDFQTEDLIVTGLSSLNTVKVKDHIQVGDEATPGNIGDIEVFKNSGQSATIYSLSDSGSARMFVGRERVSGVNEEYGGFRKGFVSGVTITGPTDLDVINFDTGNLNYYLHAGSGGPSATTGSFRWIYGQTNTILAELDADGKFTLNGNIVPNAVTLVVGGDLEAADITSSGLVTAEDGIYSTGISTFTESVEFTADVIFGDISIGGDLSIDSLLIGDDPNQGGQGTEITETSAYIAGVALFERGNSTDFVGDISADKFTGDVDAGAIIFSSSIIGPSGFSVNSSGDVSTQGNINSSATVTASNVVSDDLTVNTAGFIADLSVNTFSAPVINTDTLNVDLINVDSIQIADPISNLVVENLTVSVGLIATTITGDSLVVNNIEPTSPPIIAGVTSIFCGSDFNLSGLFDVSGVNEFRGEGLDVEYIKIPTIEASPVNKVRGLGFEASETDLTITIYSITGVGSLGAPVHTITLPYD